MTDRSKISLRAKCAARAGDVSHTEQETFIRYRKPDYGPERERYGDQRFDDNRDWHGARGSIGDGYPAGSGQSSGYGGPLFSGARPGSEFGYSGAQGGGSLYGNYGARSVFGGESRSARGEIGYGQFDDFDRRSSIGPHRGKGPKGYQRSDARIKEIISERLQDDPGIDASEITVEVESGKVTLEGTIDRRQAKHEVEDIVEQCGCAEIQNNLRVQRERVQRESARPRH